MTSIGRLPQRRNYAGPASLRNGDRVTSEQQQGGPWYQEGLRFECTQCGNCCTGAPGYVWVNAEEIAALAEHCGQSIAEFESKYVHTVGSRKSLVEFKNGDCVFFDSEKRTCKVYGLRPRQCRTWPFWDSNVKTPEAWQETCETCPGSGRGQLVAVDEIQRRLAVIKI